MILAPLRSLLAAPDRAPMACPRSTKSVSLQAGTGSEGDECV